MKTILPNNRAPASAPPAARSNAAVLRVSPSPLFKVSPSQSLREQRVSAFNPALPEDGALIIASVLRDQFNGLAAMVEAVPVINAATVDGVSTVSPGDPAQVLLSLLANALHFTFAIPQGFPGADGGPGPTGPQGPPFANAVVDGVTTLDPGQPATVSVSFDGTYVHFYFGIPRGETGNTGGQGEQGNQGNQGEQGIQGIQGPPGEVTNADLSNAINNAVSGTSSNSNAVSTLDLVVSDPPTQAEVQAVANKVDELILALRRG